MKVHNFSIVLAVKLSQCGFEPRSNLDLVRHLALIDSEYKRLFDDATPDFETLVHAFLSLMFLFTFRVINEIPRYVTLLF